MKRVMLLGAMLAVMLLMTAVPAFAQTGNAVGVQYGNHDVQSVQSAVQQEFGTTQYNVTGDNVNIQAVVQVSNINTGVVVVLIN